MYDGAWAYNKISFLNFETTLNGQQKKTGEDRKSKIMKLRKYCGYLLQLYCFVLTGCADKNGSGANKTAYLQNMLAVIGITYNKTLLEEHECPYFKAS